MSTGNAPFEGEIKVLDGPRLHSGTRVVVGVIDAGSLVDRYVIPRRDHRRKEGYQREVSTSRVRRMVDDLKAGRVNLPTAILLNLREFDPKTDLIDRQDGKYLRLNGKPVFVVDGQHRLEGLKKLVDEDPDRWATFTVAVVCLLGANEHEEMREFYVVNSTAKSVRTDLALDLLKQSAESDPDVMEGLLARGEDWKVRGQTLIEALERQSTIWRGRIRFPGEPKGPTMITSSGMVTSVKPLLSTPYLGQLTIENQVKILDAFWQGIRKVLPEAFDDPEGFVIQKMTGTLAMHTVLIHALEYVRSKGWSVIESESYANTLGDALAELQGDTRDGAVVSGIDFWRAGAEGAAGSFSSNAGRRVLTAKIRAGLPEPEVE